MRGFDVSSSRRWHVVLWGPASGRDLALGLGPAQRPADGRVPWIHVFCL